MMERDQLAELLKDAERKAWEMIGLLSAAKLEAKRNGETQTLHFIEAAQSVIHADDNFIDSGITKAIEAHTHAVKTERAR